MSENKLSQCYSDILKNIDIIQSLTHNINYVAFSSNTLTHEATKKALILINNSTQELIFILEPQKPLYPWAMIKALTLQIAEYCQEDNLPMIYEMLQTQLIAFKETITCLSA